MGENATTNTILVLLLVVVVGFIVWFMTMRNADTTPEDSGSNAALELNIGDNGGSEESGAPQE